MYDEGAMDQKRGRILVGVSQDGGQLPRVGDARQPVAQVGRRVRTALLQERSDTSHEHVRP